MNDLFQKLNIDSAEYFLTGSRALDTLNCQVSSDNSDYDYVLLITNRHLLLNYLTQNNIPIEYSCYNGGFKFIINGKSYNIITVIWCEFKAWREALYILKHLISLDKTYQNALKNKISRYCLYEQLRGIIKTAQRLGDLS